MNVLHRLLLSLAAGLACMVSVEAAESRSWESSLVTLEVTLKEYDFFQPWTTPTRSIRKHGLVIGDREVLTTAQNLPTETLVRLQKGGVANGTRPKSSGSIRTLIWPW